MVWALVGLLAGLLLAEVLIQVRAARVVLAMIENSPPFRIESLPPDPDAERFEVQTKDGLTLRGSIYRPPGRAPRGLIVFCHEFGGNHSSAMLYASALRKAGFDILAFDFRNLGNSDKLAGYEPLHWLTHYEVTDLHAVLDYIQQRPDLREFPLGLFGISRGGNAALYAAAERSEVRCVASDGAFETRLMLLAHARRWISLVVTQRVAELVPWWHVRFTLWLARMASQLRRRCRYAMLEGVLPKLKDKPLLVIVGERDTYVLTEVPAEMCRLAGQPDALWVVPHAKHNMARLVDTNEYDRRLVDFFAVLDRTGETPLSEVSRTAIPVNSGRLSAESAVAAVRPTTPLRFSMASDLLGLDVAGR